MSSLEEHQLAHMMIEQENEQMLSRLIVMCDTCLIFSEELKRANKYMSMSDLPTIVRKNWWEHVKEYHGLG